MVTGGPDSGFSHTLGLRRYIIGRGDDADIRINDSDVSRSHCEISLTESGASLRDLNSTNGTAVNGRLLGDAIVPISPGDLIGIGTSSLQLLEFEDRRAQLKSDGDGGFVFNRSPRILKSPETVEIVVPSPPRVPSKRPFPWIAALAPLAVAILMAVLLKQPTFLLFAVLSPVTVFGTQWAERRHDRREYESAVADHQEESEQYERELGQALDAERQLIAQLWPDPAAAVSACTGPGLRLWERRTADPDYLNIRVGVHTGPANIKLRALATGRTLDAPELRDAPTGFNLRETGVAGVAVPGQTGRGVLRAVITQLIAFHAADDLRLCVVAPHSTWQEFKWLRWAPHVRARDRTGPLQLALDMSSARAMVDELVRVMTTRREQRSSNQHLSFLPDYVVLLDQASELRRDSELGRLLREGPDLGVYALCIEDDDRKLPEECRAVLTARAATGTTAALQLRDGSSVTPILLDQVPTEIAAGASRSIAGVRRVSVAGGESEIPPTCRLFDLFPDDVLDPANIAHRWHTAGKTTSAIVGMGADGPERLDIAADGPHVLIAGTPGSGKSEFLQSWITSLALCNRPDEFTFILIDFKGGAAFSELGRLPHTVGVLTNLDQQLTGRALTSLESELRRRQEISLGTARRNTRSIQRCVRSSLRYLRSHVSPLSLTSSPR